MYVRHWRSREALHRRKPNDSSGKINRVVLRQFTLLSSEIRSYDEWFRRRLCMCYIKQWRKWRTRILNLIKLNVVKKYAIEIRLSSKVPWKLAGTFGRHSGIILILISKNKASFHVVISGFLSLIGLSANRWEQKPSLHDYTYYF